MREQSLVIRAGSQRTFEIGRRSSFQFESKLARNLPAVASVRNAAERSKAPLGRAEETQILKARYAGLTSRERDVLALVVVGLLNKQVGSRLGISEVKVKKHRGNAMRKMQAESLAELVKKAARLRLRQAPTDTMLAVK